ncbi:protein mono-ADP-ribosyltransferase PARP11-like isoform X3 [Pimephales promelas]|uniref:protein mono-ADP-ribosyltransferase PARP11-like isoform X3 n=1 Tax=Pimephales promelas TaxID=90988 RepID=UPI001955CA66|nr:protein mono-ADP-ribosyltransferase PARP11-like isoform X3 [Pimephales promelas]KAG1953452.1 protein mono-ADP-ribosyltransferase PARP11 [Pimephales promelas]KAG1953455.1 protein mono-ADP-ribosyltransferase PARP11 [Pimephales promelas]
MLGEFARLTLEDEVEYMDTSETQWHWYYKANCGVWHRVEDDPENVMFSDDLERYYLRNPQGVINTTAAGVQIEINFAARTQSNLRTGKTRQIKRSFLTDIGFSLWVVGTMTFSLKMTVSYPNQLISLRKDNSEYQKMERYVRDVGLLRDTMILSIKRIQNVDLWELFCRKKTQMMRIKGQSDIEEQMLFHGTSAKNVHSICTFNFNCRLSDKRRRGHVLGKGTYFAKHASLATRYSEAKSTKVMLIARVLVGKYKTGHQDYCTPNDDQNENIHDSCVDDEICPRIFVIFDSTQIYPEYVLEYR